MCSSYRSVRLFFLIFCKHKGATVSTVIEKRESIVCYIKFFRAIGFAEELRQVRKIINKAVFCGRSNGFTIFVEFAALAIWNIHETR